MKKLTIIIPFANEKDEVENTIQSILSHSDQDIDIIVINDASDDNYDYSDSLQKYDIKYIVNKERLGIAASRDLGVRLCETDYFLLLDAHMRFYDSTWASVLISELDKNPRMILCAQTKVLYKKENIIIEQKGTETYWGAYVNLYSSIDYLEPKWSYLSFQKQTPDSMTTQMIPCILGAGYAASKHYWLYLNGLKGLLSYGNDEVLISLKAWLEGGVCKLLPQVVIGHIYRQVSPFKHYTERRIYNRLYICYLLCPYEYQKKLNAIEKIKYPQKYFEAWKLFYNNFDEIELERKKIEKIKTKDFSYFEAINKSYMYKDKESRQKKEKYLIRSILYVLSCTNLNNINLIQENLGVTLLLYYFGRYFKNQYITKLADSFLNKIIEQANVGTPLNIANGLLGIGWGLCFLSQQKFIKNVDHILSELDGKVIEISPKRIQNVDLEYGLGGILLYVLCRLYNQQSSQIRFPQDYLFELYIRAKEIIESDLYNLCPEIYIEYILWYEKRKRISPTYLYDILMLPGWNKYSKSSKDVSLNGLTGMCIEFIINNLEP